MSARRIIVERPIADEFTARLAEKTGGLKAGDPKEHDTIIGPLINAGRARRRSSAGSTTRCASGAQGARGRRGGRALLPGDAARRRAGRLGVRADRDVRPGRRDRGRRQRRARRSSARTRRATASRRGSSRRTPTAASRSRSSIDAGIVHVNDQTVGDEPQMPFGGVKDSGFGPLRRQRGRGRVHRAALDHRAERVAPFPF